MRDIVHFVDPKAYVTISEVADVFHGAKIDQSET